MSPIAYRKALLGRVKIATFPGGTTPVTFRAVSMRALLFSMFKFLRVFAFNCSTLKFFLSTFKFFAVAFHCATCGGAVSFLACGISRFFVRPAFFRFQAKVITNSNIGKVGFPLRVFGGSSAHWRPRNFVFFVFLVSRVLRLKNPSVFSVHFPLLFFLDTTSHWLLRPGRAFSISAGSLQGTGGPAAEKLLAVCRNCICCICSSPGVFAPSCFA